MSEELEEETFRWSDAEEDSSGTVRLQSEVGGGKEGTIYTISNTDDRVAKIFNEDKRSVKKEKIRAMLRNPVEDPTRYQRQMPTIAWPSELLFGTTGKFMGYLMPQIDTDQFEEAHNFADENLGWHSTSKSDRYLPSINLALTVFIVHKQQHAIGDMNHENILINSNHVVLLDCDSFHITENGTEYPDVMSHPRYAPIEKRGDTLRSVQRADRFGLAIHIFQFLMEGEHPFIATGNKAVGGRLQNKIRENRFPYHDPRPGELEPPARAPQYSDLPEAIRKLFNKAFTHGKYRPRYRPEAAKWALILIQESGLTQVPKELVSTLESTVTSRSPTPESSNIDDPTSIVQKRWGDETKGTEDDDGSERRAADALSAETKTDDWRQEPSSTNQSQSHPSSDSNTSDSGKGQSWVDDVRENHTSDSSIGTSNSRSSSSSGSNDSRPSGSNSSSHADNSNSTKSIADALWTAGKYLLFLIIFVYLMLIIIALLPFLLDWPI